MLSAAHALALDAKNLFDVVDSIRQRYDNLFPASNPKDHVSSSNFEPSSSHEPINELGAHLKSSTSGDLLHGTGIYDNDLHQSFSSQLQLQGVANNSGGSGSLQRGLSLDPTNEPLRIVEENLGSPGEHMYCNTSALHGHA